MKRISVCNLNERKQGRETYACSFIFKLDSLPLVFWKSKHLEVASDSFCFLINSSWLLIFALIIVLFIFTGFNIYCCTGIHFS